MITYSEADLVRWKYNCLDALYPLEIAELQKEQISKSNTKLQEFYNFQQHEVAPALIDIMNTGIRIDLEKKEKLKIQLTALLEHVKNRLNYILGEEFNISSPVQIKTIFKDLLGIKLKINKKTKTESCASAYMLDYLKEYPEYSIFITLILEYRSIAVFLKTFVSAEVDEDGRMRTSYNCAGTKTYRLSSRKNAFGKGANLANIPSKGKIDLKYSLLADSSEDEDETIVGDYEGLTELPNCKEFFLPDEGYMFFNVDYSGADAMVVAADSGCKWLLDFFKRNDQKLYVYVAEHYYQREIKTTDKEYKIFKQYIHGTHYGMMEAKAAMNARISLPDAKKIRQWYFRLNPEIPDWHKRIASDIRTRGFVENIFGARCFFLNKDDPTILNQAIASIPQSTIAVLANKGLVAIRKYEKQNNVYVLMQVHDAVAGQHLITDITAQERITNHMQIELPYKNPITIPVDYSSSKLSYGGCK